MIIIAHRGNINGPDTKNENSPGSIYLALIKGFHVEIDVWYVNGSLYLGHDKPVYLVTSEFVKQSSKLWCHAKNPAAFKKLIELKVKHAFWHESDRIALTTSKIFWVYPGEITPDIAANSVYVMPDIHLGPYENSAVRRIYDCVKASGAMAVCTDYAHEFRQTLLNDMQGNK